MDEQAVSRSIPGSAGLLGALTVVGLAALGLWSVVDGYALDPSNDYVAPTLGVLVVTLLFVGGLAALGARSKEWLEGPYW